MKMRMHFPVVALPVIGVVGGAACLAGPVDLASIYAPEVVAVQPTYAVHDLCRTADGEIRHYGWQMVKGKKQRVYVASRDEGLSWKTFLAAPGEAGYMERSPESGDWIGFEKEEHVPGRESRRLVVLRSKVGPGDPNPARTPFPWDKHFVRHLFHMKTRALGRGLVGRAMHRQGMLPQRRGVVG